MLDTPGLADARGAQQDELHNKSIVTQIREHIDSVTAVLVLANGTVPRITVGTDCALSTLCTILPTSLANVAFVLTNVSGLLYQNFSGNTLRDALEDAPRFTLNNPIALQRKYLKLGDDPSVENGRDGWRREVEAGEQNAFETLVDLFDWLDGLEPLPIIPRHGEPEP
jgi:hypothetical protein